ncbi:MAG: hypothetical protein RDU01_06210 [Thermodesulfovibrionales bacterium]|nr:hypothetical protein [Thermodesulfovibrionales bacterium]
MEGKFRCPRCGFEQPPTDDCRNCQVNIPKFIELQKRRNIIPGGAVREQEPKAQQEAPVAESIPKPEKTPERFDLTGEMPGIGDLFGRSWEIFKERFIILVVLFLLSLIFMAIPVALFSGIGYLIAMVLPDSKNLLITIGGFVGAFFGMIGMFWGIAAFIYAVVERDAGIKNSLGRGWHRIGSFIWLFSVLGFIITGGFLLLIIPGILFGVWFAFAQFILAGEDIRGMNALLKSKEYVRDRWFDVFLRLFVIWIISVVAGMVPVIGPILSILLMPFMMIYAYLVYQDLRSLKGDVAFVSSSGEKFKWIGAGTLGYIVAPLILIGILGTTFLTSFFLLKSILTSPGQEMTVPFQPPGFMPSPSPETPYPQDPGSVPPQASETGTGTTQVLPSQAETSPHDVMVYIYSLNYKGSVRLNGEEIYEIKGEQDMNYNYSGGGKFHYGTNTIDVEYESLPNPWKTEIKIKVYKYDWNTSKETTLNEWVITDKEGRKSFEIEINKE